MEAEFQRNLPFASSVANSAVDPDDPKTVTGITTKPFYVDSADPYKRSNPQPVAVIAKRSLGAVTAKYRINGGAVRSARMSEWAGRSTYDPASVYYHQMRGVVTGTNPGDSVEVWFEGGGQRSDSFTYRAVSESGRRVLVVAAEDYTGASPPQSPGPNLLPNGTSTSFETGLDGWTVTGPPAGSAPNSTTSSAPDASGFPVGNVIATPRSLLMGFGLEGVSTQAERNVVMGRVLDHLL